MSPGIERCPGGAPGGASASSQGGADIDELRQRPLARRPLASGGAKRPREDGPARGLDKEYGRWRASPEKLAVCKLNRISHPVIPGRERSSRARNPETDPVRASGFRVRSLTRAPRNDAHRIPLNQIAMLTR